MTCKSFGLCFLRKSNIVLPSPFKTNHCKACCYTADTEERFRKAVSNSKGMKKGNISIAIEEAIDLWIEEQKRKERNAGKR